MRALQSNTDAFLVAIPMVVLLFAAFFRLDELISSPRKQREARRGLCDWDENGIPICTDPDRIVYRIPRDEK
jgi:hypothetical protein